MRNKFTELIEQGVARFDYTPVAPQLPEQDPICRQYNNIWSIPSDTHMHLNHETGERYITGHMVGIEERWNHFVCATNWGGITFKNTGFWSLCDFLQSQGLCGRYSSLNGETIYLVTPIENTIPAAELSACMMECPTCCTTTESKMPLSVGSLTVDGNTMKVLECYHKKSNLYEVCDAMNESIYVKGNKWTVVNESIMCPIGNKVYVL